MVDGIQAQTKTQRNLSYGREISVSNYYNPGTVNLNLYRTRIDPTIAIAKNLEGFGALQALQIQDPDYTINPAYLSQYTCGLTPAELLYKQNLISAGGIAQLLIGSVEPGRNDDIGPINIGDNTGNDDNSHKIIVTDLSTIWNNLGTGLIFDTPIFGAGVWPAIGILHPVSSRKIAKTSDGIIHAVVSIQIAGVSRIIYLYSNTGGETWTAEIVDSAEANMEYVAPAITVDKDDGIHITYSKWDNIEDYFFCLFSGGATPAGWTLLSGAGGIFDGEFLMGYDSVAFGYSDTHVHPYSGVQTGTLEGVGANGSGPTVDNGQDCGNHVGYADSFSLGDVRPLFRSLKVISYPGLPPNLPQDAIIMLDTNAMPANVTRYAVQDGYFIRGGPNVGDLGGATTHIHTWSGQLSGNHTSPVGVDGSGGLIHEYPYPDPHSHYWWENLAAADNLAPYYNVVLGHVDTPINLLPQHMLSMWANYPYLLGPLSGFFTKMSSVGGTLYNRIFRAAPGYWDGGGSVTHNHPNNAWQYATTGGSTHSNLGISGAVCTAAPTHDHEVAISVADQYTYPAVLTELFTHQDIDLPLGSFGKDIFYRYKPKGGIWTAPLNLSNMISMWTQTESSILIAPNDTKYVLWSGAGLGGSTNGYRIIAEIEQPSGGAWSAPTFLTTDIADFQFSSMDIDVLGDLHTTWSDVLNWNAVQYRKKQSGIWQAIENIDTTFKVGQPSNILADQTCVPHIAYNIWAGGGAAKPDILYTNRLGGAWNAPINISNKAVFNYTQANGQLFLDNKGGIVIMWGGQGYGTFPTRFAPVLRYRKPDATWLPGLGTDAEQILTDEDKDTLLPCAFWHQFPQVEGIYHNYPISGLTMLMLYNIRGVNHNIADLDFVSVDALVGDYGAVGSGGDPGAGTILPTSDNPDTNTPVQGTLQITSFTLNIRGSINPCRISPPRQGLYIS